MSDIIQRINASLESPHRRIGPLALDEELWDTLLDNYEIHLTPVGVAEVPQLEVAFLRILLTDILDIS